MMTDFVGMPKIARLSRTCVITEKIDGTNAQVFIGEDGEFLVGSRSRWITPRDDNFGFAAWAYEHKDELMEGLGPGRHLGEWWGKGIQRNYGLDHRRFSLFNTERWCQYGSEPKNYPTADPRYSTTQEVAPECCHVVPVLSRGLFNTIDAEYCINDLRELGSYAAPGYRDPEGVVVFHIAGNKMFKKTVHGDESPKGMK